MRTPSFTHAAAAILVAALTHAAGAQTPRTDATPPLPLDLTLLDAPYNTSFGGRAPSMLQALDATAATYEAAHAGLQRLLEPRHPKLAKAAVITFDAMSILELVLPFTDVWVHEEFHRSALGVLPAGDDGPRHDDMLRSRACPFHIGDRDLAIGAVGDCFQHALMCQRCRIAAPLDFQLIRRHGQRHVDRQHKFDIDRFVGARLHARRRDHRAGQNNPP